MIKVIVDTNIGHRVLKTDDDPVFSHLSEAIFYGKRYKVMLSYGGSRLTREYQRAGLQGIIAKLDSAGRAAPSNHLAVDAEALKIKARCTSNDDHIVALGRISAARVVASLDKGLSKDFRNLVTSGRTYSKRSHYKLLL